MCSYRDDVGVLTHGRVDFHRKVLSRGGDDKYIKFRESFIQSVTSILYNNNIIIYPVARKMDIRGIYRYNDSNNNNNNNL